jgi:hypothetical protein
MQMESNESKSYALKLAKQVAGHKKSLRERAEEAQSERRDRILVHGTD